MKPEAQKTEKLSSSILFDLESAPGQKTMCFEGVKCKEGKQCINLCSSQHCQSHAAICADHKCSCRSAHRKEKICEKVQLEEIISLMQSERMSLNSIHEWLNTQFDQLVDWVSEEREKVHLQIKSFETNQIQENFLMRIQSGECDKLTGNKVHEVVKDFNTEPKSKSQQRQIIQNQFNNQWQEDVLKIKQKLNEFRSFVTTTLSKTSLYSHDLNSKVAVTEAERLTVSEMLNSNDERKVSYYKLLYRGSENDFKVSKFWQNCDQKADTVTLIHTEFDKVIGGYTPLSWKIKGDGGGSWQYDPQLESFLFSVTEKAKFTHNESMMHPAIQIDIRHGPTFGIGRDLLISNNANNSNRSFAHIGHSYENSRVQKSTKEAWKFFIGSTEDYYFKIKEWQVWQVVFK